MAFPSSSVFCLVAEMTAQAATTPGLAPPSPLDEPGSMAMQLVRTLVVLGVVVLTVYLVLNVGLRRLMGLSGGRVPGQNGLMRVVERLPLETRRALYVVEAAGEYFLVGAGESGFSFLSKLDVSEVKRFLDARASNKGSAFAPFLERWKSKQGGPPPPPTA